MEIDEKELGPKGRATRERILKAATEVFVESLGHIELEQVAEKAETSMGLFYRYFSSKGMIQAAVIDAYFDRLSQVVWQTPGNESDWFQVQRSRLQRYIAFAYSDNVGRVLFGQIETSAEGAEAKSRGIATQSALISAELERGQKLGFVDKSIEPSIMCMMLVLAINGAISIGLNNDGSDMQNVTKSILHLVTRVIKPEDPQD